MIWTFFFLVSSAESVLKNGSVRLENGKTVSLQPATQTEAQKLLGLNCELDCADKCVKGANGLDSVKCLSHCGCKDLIGKSETSQGVIVPEKTSEKSLSIPSTVNEEKIKWWLNIHSQKIKNFETCSSECGVFCERIKGNSQVCINKCTSKFCQEPAGSLKYYWGAIYLGISLLGLIMIQKISKTLMKKGKLETVNIETDYKRI